MSDAGAPRPVSPALAGATNAKDRTLLIADDDAAFRNRIARALELRGFIVTAVGSVAEALAQTARPPLSPCSTCGWATATGWSSSVRCARRARTSASSC
jgi:hypothetical protein